VTAGRSLEDAARSAPDLAAALRHFGG
jgi:ribulose 1,5-bisphosphate carboxylase large subunit-like protein